MRSLSITLIFLLALVIQAGEQKRLSIAITEIEGRGLAEGEAVTLTDALRNYLINTGAFRVMERGKMDMILKEQGFQQSGACTDEACLVEMGQLLGVEQMITGSVGKVGRTFSVNVRMINIATGEITRTLNKFYKGEIDGLLTKVIPEIAEEFAETDKAPEAAVEPAPAPAPAPRAAPQKKPAKKAEIKEKKDGSSHALLFVGLGALAVGGGIAAYMILSKDEETPAPSGPGSLEVTW
jgi:hypothetical protein